MLKATITAENLTSQPCIEKCGSCTAAMSQKLLWVRIYTQSSLGTFVSVVLCFNSIVFLTLDFVWKRFHAFQWKKHPQIWHGIQSQQNLCETENPDWFINSRNLKSSQSQWYHCLAAHLMPISNGLRSQSSLFGSKFSSWRKLVKGMSKW